MSLEQLIEQANEKAMDILLHARPVWTGVRNAIEVVPGMTEKTILVAGPPIAVENIVKPVRTAVCGAIVYEGLAGGAEEAWNKVISGEVTVLAGQDSSVANGAAMATSAHTPVIVCEDPVYGGKGFCALHPGTSTHVLRWGYYDAEVQKDLEWFRDHYGPALGKGVEKAGGIDLVQVLSRTAGMGDENHNRQPAATMFMALQLIPHLLDSEDPYRDRIIREYASNDRFFLHVMMAGCEAVMDPIKGMEYSTVMTAMGGNGVEFGLQFAGTGRQWFTSEAPYILGMFLKPDYTKEDMLGFLGDSCVTEVYGLGGISAIAGPAYVKMTGSTFQDARDRTEAARQICLGEHTFAPVPWDDFRGLPCGVDMRKVVGLGILPTSHGGGTLKEGGQGTIGSALFPMECFRKGLVAFSNLVKNGVTA